MADTEAKRREEINTLSAGFRFNLLCWIVEKILKYQDDIVDPPPPILLGKEAGVRTKKVTYKYIYLRSRKSTKCTKLSKHFLL